MDKQKLKEWIGSSDVPAAFAIFPRDLSHPPREWAERFFNVQRWTEMPRGGHFAALEEPELAREGHSRVLPAAARRTYCQLGGQLPVGTIAAVSTMRITVRSGARVRCSTPFGTTNPSRGCSSTTRPGVTPSASGSRSMSKVPSTT